MLNSRKTSRKNLVLAAVLAAAAAAASAPALAQTAVDEVVVTGRYGVGDEVRSISAPVSYRDLDLTTEAGRDVLRDRVRLTANDLCRRLGESGMGGTAAAPSCERDAIASAQVQERTAFAAAAPPAYAAVAPAPPDEPYAAPAASSYGEQASATVTTETVTNGPVPDTQANRARFGGPISNGGRRTTPAGN